MGTYGRQGFDEEKKQLKNRIVNKTQIAAALVLSAAFLSAGCGNDKTGEVQTGADAAREEISDDKDLMEGDDTADGKQDRGTADEKQDRDTADGKQDQGTADEKRDQDTADGNDVTVNTEAASDKTDIYDDVLSQYQDMVQNDFYEELRETDQWDSCFGEDIGLEIRTHKQNIYYTFYDIDGNGTMELIVAGEENGISNPVFSPWNYDLYGYNGTDVVPIFPEMEFGYRTNFSLFENGVIEVFYSSSAAESGVDFYKIGSDGFTPELADSFSSIGHLEGEEPVFTYFQNGKEITQSQYDAGIKSYEVTLSEQPDWIQIQ